MLEYTPLAEQILVVVAVIQGILLIPAFIELLPYIADSLFRARGSVALESSVRVSRSRNRVALVLLLPCMLMIFRLHLWTPALIDRLTPEWQLAAVTAAFFVYSLVRVLMFWILKPRRRYDNYWLSHRASYTFLILMIMLLLPTWGIFWIFGVSFQTTRLVIYVEIGMVYAAFLLSRAQILNLSYRPLRTFLYLCGLEIVPAFVWVISALVM